MIKKTASSEIFDIYASRMISKRALLNKTAASPVGALKYIEELAIGATKVGAKELEAPAIAALNNPTAKASLKVISEATEAEAKGLTKALVNSSKITETSTLILSKAEQCGYSAFSSSDDFLKEFSKDFKAMGEELTTLGNTEAELAAFYTKHKKAVDFYHLLKKDPELFRAIKETSRLGEQQLLQGGRAISQVEAEAAHTVGGAAKEGAGILGKWESRATSGATIASKAIGLVTLGVIAYGLKEGFNSPVAKIIMNIFASPESERHIKEVKAAIDCINNIDLIPGSPAVAAREKIINNINIFSKYESANNITDQKELIETVDAAGLAAQELMGDDSTEGSIQNFLVLIAKDPGGNLSGFSELEAGGAGAAAGGAVGFLMGGPIGAVIGATLVGSAGWYAISKYYKSEINCLGKAGDAIKQFDESFKSEVKANSKGREGGTSQSTSNPDSNSNATGSSTPLLENMVGAMSQSKIYNVPGLRNIFLNEKKIVSRLVAGYGVSQASNMIFMANPNIGIILKSIQNPNLRGTVNAETIEANPVLQNLAKAIVFGSRAAEKSKPISSSLISQSKIKENKMKKESKSINNQELLRKAAEARVSYFGDANLGLKDQLTKSYYAGLTGMYNEQPPKRSSDYKNLYGFQEETGHDLMAESHPKSVTLADAMGKGGLVENNLEQQQKSIYVATTTPSGNFQSKYAQTVSYLQKLAKAADSQGKKEVSKLINQTIQKLK